MKKKHLKNNRQLVFKDSICNLYNKIDKNTNLRQKNFVTFG